MALVAGGRAPTPLPVLGVPSLPAAADTGAALAKAAVMGLFKRSMGLAAAMAGAARESLIIVVFKVDA